jgi:septin family protein
LQFSSLETPGYVGFANLPNQVHRKSVKKGFEFTLMVVGKADAFAVSKSKGKFYKFNPVFKANLDLESQL